MTLPQASPGPDVLKLRFPAPGWGQAGFAQIIVELKQGSRHTPCAVWTYGTRSVPTTLESVIFVQSRAGPVAVRHYS